jgi:hypothetical protein
VEVILPVVVLAALVALLVLQPLRSSSAGPDPVDRRADLEVAKESKYREIKDAELDYRMGKTSEEDWRALDAELRAQAIELLKQLDELDPTSDERPAASD